MPLTVADMEQLDTLRSIMRTVENRNNVGQVLASFSRYLRDNIDRAGDRDLFAEVCDICGEGRSREVENIMTEYVRIRDVHEPVFNQLYSRAECRFTSLEEARAYMNQGANEENSERISETRPRAALRRLSNVVTNALSPGQVSDLRPTPPQHVNARNAQENLTRAREIFSTQRSNQYLEQFHRDLAELLDRYSLEDVRSVILRSGELPYREHVFEMRRGQGIRQEPLPKPGILAWQRRLNKIVLCRVQEDPTLDADAKTMQAIEGQEMLFRVQSRAVGRNRTELVLVPVFKDHEATGLLLAYLEVTDVVFIREVEQEEFEGILEERRKEAKRSRRRIDFED